METLDRIESKLDRITDKLGDHGETLVRHEALHLRNSDDLEEHIRGVRALEARVKPLEDVHKTWKVIMAIGGVLVTVVGPIVSWAVQHWMGK